MRNEFSQIYGYCKFGVHRQLGLTDKAERFPAIIKLRAPLGHGYGQGHAQTGKSTVNNASVL